MAHRAYINDDGVVYPSVTEVLGFKPKPWLERWKEKWGALADRKTLAATKIGSDFHLYAEAAARYGYFAIPDNRRLGKMAMNFLQWCKASGLRVTDCELHVVSHMYQYAGTFDAVGYLADRPKTLALFDWKTSSGIYPDMALQLSAYAQAYREQTGKVITRGFIVHVSKDKPNHLVTVKEYKLGKRLFNKFLKRLREYREVI